MSVKDIGESDFKELLLACHEISSLFPEGVIFIGGIAVYFHTINSDATRELAEFTHDADFYISLADMADLRDMEEVVANRRLSKHQLIKRGFEFDIYTERHSALIVPYDQVAAYSVKYDAIRVACLEHLFVLKLEAYRDRHASAKGQKDANDLIRIALAASALQKPLNSELIIGYLSDDHQKLLGAIQRGAQFMSLAKGNAKQAKNLREKFARALKDFS
ncbi:MAG: hypothetical protein DCC75_11750 [Proteobacteria bacterium]|nr:MAG: hypothetical protein DCC75_11750 [Pseudomonadota bacterium]